MAWFAALAVVALILVLAHEVRRTPDQPHIERRVLQFEADDGTILVAEVEGRPDGYGRIVNLKHEKPNRRLTQG